MRGQKPPLPLSSAHFPVLFSSFFPLSFIPMCREAWVMKSSLSAWPAHLCLSLLPLVQPLWPSMLIWPTNSVQVWQTRVLLNSGQTASSLSLRAVCDSVSLSVSCFTPTLWSSLQISPSFTSNSSLRFLAGRAWISSGVFFLVLKKKEKKEKHLALAQGPAVVFV